VFAFTTDLDWASEEAVGETFRLFHEFEVPLTPFVTHASAVVRERFEAADLHRLVGVHPNVQLQSSHGVNETEVLESATKLWPEARGFRCHGYYDSSHFCVAAKARGFAWDSNLALFVQPQLRPLEHFSGLVRFPSWWDDDTHLGKGFAPDLSVLAEHLLTPGLKVLSVHPVHVAGNTPSLDHYETTRSDASAAFDGPGIQTLLRALLAFLRERDADCFYLDDLFVEHSSHDEDVQDRRARPYQPGRRRPAHTVTEAGNYRMANTSGRAAAVRAEYEGRQARDRYATSPDVNLRELEIDFIREQLPEGRVLDVGCGNGYTLLNLAVSHPGEMVGLDFSPTLLAGARRLLAETAGLKARVSFEEGDVREMRYPDGAFDVAISERCLLNLPSRAEQWQTVREIRRVLRTGGTYLMVEGTEDGLKRLNRVRVAVGLEAIPSVSDANFSSLKFDEQELFQQLDGLFEVAEIRYFSAYYLITRVAQPLLALPRAPSFGSAINRHARTIDAALPDAGQLGHVFGLKLMAM
jgi:ubiquinone/menaquinone biosynthesis C-methylase UbiE